MKKTHPIDRRCPASFWLFASLLTAVFLCAPVKATEPLVHPKHRLVYSDLLTVRYNPVGLNNTFKLGYRYRLYNSAEALWKESHLGISISPSLTPVMYKAGGEITIRPLTVVSLYGGYHFVHWFGVIGTLQSFPDVESDYSETALERGEDNGLHYASTGHQLHAGAHLLGKLGPVIMSSNTLFIYSDMELRKNDALFYTQVYDILVADKGWLFTNDTDLLFLFESGALAGLLVGVRNTVTGAFYNDDHYRGGSGSHRVYTDRFGPLLAYVLFSKPGAAFDRPTILLLANWWLKHPYRTGADTNQAIPYLILGFKFEGDLINTRRVVVFKPSAVLRRAVDRGE